MAHASYKPDSGFHSHGHGVHTTPTGTPNSNITGAMGMSDAIKSLLSVGALDQDEFKGDTKNPSYAFDADIDGVRVDIDRSDEKLNNLELGLKYVDVFGPCHTVLVDMSGTMFEDLHRPLKPYAGVLVAYKLLRQHGTRIILVTNSWKTSKQALVKMLNDNGFYILVEDIFTSSDACKMYLKSNHLARPYFLVADTVLEDFAEEFERRRKEDSVVVGLPSTMFDYRLLSKGMELLIDGAPLIVLNMALKEESANIRQQSIGPGPFINILSCATDAEPVEVCKPSEIFYKSLCEKYGLEDLSNVLLIGDDVNEDIEGAKALGMKAILTRTGRYKLNDEFSLCEQLRPDATAEAFAMAVKYLIASNAVYDMTEEELIEVGKWFRGCSVEGNMPKEDLLKMKMERYLEASDSSKQKMDKTSLLLKLSSHIW